MDIQPTDALGRTRPTPGSAASKKGDLGVVPPRIIEDHHPSRANFRFNKIAPGMFENASGTVRFRMDGDGQFRVFAKNENGDTVKFSGMRSGNELFFRSESGELFSAQLIRHPNSEGFGLSSFQSVSRPTTEGIDSQSATHVQVNPEEGSFSSDDGTFKGSFNAETGRLAGTLEIGGNAVSFEGLIGNGQAILSLEDGRTVSVAATATQEGTFILQGLPEAISAQPPGAPVDPAGTLSSGLQDFLSYFSGPGQAGTGMVDTIA